MSQVDFHLFQPLYHINLEKILYNTLGEGISSCLHMRLQTYWVGSKIHFPFSVTSYGKTEPFWFWPSLHFIASKCRPMKYLDKNLSENPLKGDRPEGNNTMSIYTWLSAVLPWQDPFRADEMMATLQNDHLKYLRKKTPTVQPALPHLCQKSNQSPG